MQFAHIVGEHTPDSFWSQLGHIVFSWAGFAISLVLSLWIGVVVYKKFHKTEVKEEVRKK